MPKCKPNTGSRVALYWEVCASCASTRHLFASNSRICFIRVAASHGVMLVKLTQTLSRNCILPWPVYIIFLLKKCSGTGDRSEAHCKQPQMWIVSRVANACQFGSTMIQRGHNGDGWSFVWWASPSSKSCCHHSQMHQKHLHLTENRGCWWQNRRQSELAASHSLPTTIRNQALEN